MRSNAPLTLVALCVLASATPDPTEVAKNSVFLSRAAPTPPPPAPRTPPGIRSANATSRASSSSTPPGAVTCGTFEAGAACSPNTEYVPLPTANNDTSPAACAAACEAEGVRGCCWHRPTPDPAAATCQWVAGGEAHQFGGADVRSATECAGPSPAPQPEQLHVALGDAPGAMLLQWAVRNPSGATPMPARPALRYRPLLGSGGGSGGGGWMEVAPSNTGSGPGPFTQYRVTLRGLAAGAQYEYAVGWLSANSTGSNSSSSNSSSSSSSSSWPLASRLAVPSAAPYYLPSFAFFGDLGWTDNQILPLLGEECAAGGLDAVVLFGDMVYWDNGENENSFMRDMSAMTVSSNFSVPVMVSPGNGDYGGNYSRYKAQWAMPGWDGGDGDGEGAGQGAATDSLWHSFDMGPAHVVGINTEALEHASDAAVKERMLAWLAADMAAANAPAARAARPWVIVHFHRPAYTTGGSDAAPFDVFEPLMARYGVDAVFQGHVHNQERTLPVSNRTVRPGTTDPARPYFDARAPVYFTSGNPGNAEETNYFNRGFDPWTAWRSYHFGWTRLSFPNATALRVQFVATNLGGAVTDDVTLAKSTAACGFGQCGGVGGGVGGGAGASSASEPAADGGRGAARALLQRRWRERDAQDGPVPAAQVAALAELFRATGGDTGSWLRSDNWPDANAAANASGTDPCDPAAPWYGVSCTRVTERTLPALWNASAARGVTALHLAANGLRGTLPDSLGAALGPSLQYLELSSNALRGTLPASLLRGMPRLHTLYAEPRTDDAADKLTGTLPADMGAASGLPNLRFLGLCRNALSGEIPPSLSELSCHSTTATGAPPTAADPSVGGAVGCLIWMMDNNFTGAIPRAMCRATYDEVYIGGNDQLECPRPCLKVGYGNWPSQCSSVPCTPC